MKLRNSFLWLLLLSVGLLSTGVFYNFTTVWAQDPCSGPNPPIPCQNADPAPQDVFILPEYTPRTVDLNQGEFDIHATDIDEFEEFGPRFIRLLSGIVVLIAILVFMIGAGFWIFSAGNESLVERGKDMMMYSIIGLLFVLGAYVVVKVVQIILYSLGT